MKFDPNYQIEHQIALSRWRGLPAEVRARIIDSLKESGWGRFIDPENSQIALHAALSRLDQGHAPHGPSRPAPRPPAAAQIDQLRRASGEKD